MATSLSDAVASNRTRKRVLIVDDEQRLAQTLCMLLESDYECDLAGDVSAAKRLLEQPSRYDAILCDLTLRGGESGISLHAWLASRNASAARRMVFMTGGAHTDEARQFLEQSTNPCLEKPFGFDEVVSSFARLPRAT
jgi:DNA-binding NtrC family response regulator